MIEHRFTLDLSAEQALVAHRDGLPAFASDLPGLRAVTPTSREEDGSALVLSHHWQGDLSVLPAPIRRFVDEKAVSWRDVTRWDPTTNSATWSIHVPVLGSAPVLSGTHRFTDTPRGCIVDVQAELTFIAGSDTRLLGMRLGPLVAPMLTAAIRSLLTRVIAGSSRALTRYVAGSRKQAA